MIVRCSLLASLAVLAACRPDAPPGAGEVERVVVLVVDGIRMEESLGTGTTAANGAASDQFWTAVREKLLPEGTVVTPAWNAGITITAPAHCNLAAGARVPLGNFVATEGVGAYVPDIPTLFEAVASGPGGSGRLVANTDLVAPMGHSAYPGLGAAVGATLEIVTEEGSERPSIEDAPVLDRVLELLTEDRPALLVANLHAVDRAGHEGPDGEYTDRAAAMGDQLADFWRQVQRDPDLADRTVVVITSDHGRHDQHQTDQDWRNHGDGCSGCRQVPMLWLGPGIEGGREVTAPYTLDDLGVTVAALLDAPLPFGEGRLMTEVVGAGATTGLAGETEVAVSDGVLAARRWVDDDARRSEIVVDGVVVSSPGAFAAEAPVVASGGGRDAVCWRELALPGDGLRLPWTARCLTRAGGAWEDIGYPYAEVSPVTPPALTVDGGGRVWVGASTSTSGAVSDANEDGDVKLFWWSADRGWVVPPGGVTYVSFVTSSAVVVTPERSFVAFGTSDQGAEQGRFTRHVEVREVVVDGDTATWSDHYAGALGVDDAGTPWERREWPALALVDGTLHLAMLAYGEGGTTVLWTTSPADGADWGELRRVDDSGRVFTHLPPRFWGDALYWARLEESGEASVCRLAAGEATPSCLPTGAERLRGLAPGADGVWVSADEGAWTTRFLAF